MTDAMSSQRLKMVAAAVAVALAAAAWAAGGLIGPDRKSVV